MTRYRSRPLEIEARRFAGSPTEMIDTAAWAGGIFAMERQEDGAVLPTIELPIEGGIFSLIASEGDWLVRDPETGEIAVWTEEAFRQAWEPLEDAEPWPEGRIEDPLDLLADREDDL